MSFSVHFYNSQSDYRVINKTLNFGETLSGVLRDGSSVMFPDIMFEYDSASISHYNYLYIPSFSRFYRINSVESIRNGLWLVHAEVDVLMSFRTDINNLAVVVDKQTMTDNGDEYIDDSSLVVENMTFEQSYQYTSTGFLDNPVYILMTAG